MGSTSKSLESAVPLAWCGSAFPHPAFVGGECPTIGVDGCYRTARRPSVPRLSEIGGTGMLSSCAMLRRWCPGEYYIRGCAEAMSVGCRPTAAIVNSSPWMLTFRPLLGWVSGERGWRILHGLGFGDGESRMICMPDPCC